MQRRKFLKNSTLSTAGILSAPLLANQQKEFVIDSHRGKDQKQIKPMVIATWDVPNATARAWELLSEGKSSLDAVEEGVKIEEADESNQSVGKGGRPDRDGNVTLDACIMDKHSQKS